MHTIGLGPSRRSQCNILQKSAAIILVSLNCLLRRRKRQFGSLPLRFPSQRWANMEQLRVWVGGGRQEFVHCAQHPPRLLSSLPSLSFTRSSICCSVFGGVWATIHVCRRLYPSSHPTVCRGAKSAVGSLSTEKQLNIFSIPSLALSNDEAIRSFGDWSMCLLTGLRTQFSSNSPFWAR